MFCEDTKIPSHNFDPSLLDAELVDKYSDVYLQR